MVRLQLASSEASQSPEATAIDFFVAEVARRSGGTISVSVTMESGVSDQGNIARATSGEIAMAMVAARAWDDVGVTSLQALESPFLITTHGLAVAATSGDLADKLMSGLTGRGVRGLALWPIDLRHPLSFGKPFLSPADMKGATIRFVGSKVTEDVVRALGGNPVHPDEVDDALLDGVESAFDRAYIVERRGTYTGNVTFYPRVEVLFISETAFARLSADQQTALTSAALATREHVLGGIRSDADQAKAYCAAGGGSVALASSAQLAEFSAALRPIATSIERDPLARDLVAAIRALPAPAPEPAVAAC
jgi:TRAP-type C4-dicarboxylate transport system substrate-binding protein